MNHYLRHRREEYRSNGKPSCTEPSEGSDLMSERLGIPSTKYGPSICCGVPSSINDGVNVHVLFVDALISVAVSSEDGGGPNGAGKAQEK